jgi:hypothetical protein
MIGQMFGKISAAGSRGMQEYLSSAFGNASDDISEWGVFGWLFAVPTSVRFDFSFY